MHSGEEEGKGNRPFLWHQAKGHLVERLRPRPVSSRSGPLCEAWPPGGWFLLGACCLRVSTESEPTTALSLQGIQVSKATALESASSPSCLCRAGRGGLGLCSKCSRTCLPSPGPQRSLYPSGRSRVAALQITPHLTDNERTAKMPSLPVVHPSECRARSKLEHCSNGYPYLSRTAGLASQHSLGTQGGTF